MTDQNRIPQRRPTGQDLDRQYDELHEDSEEFDADEVPHAAVERQEKEQPIEGYAEDLKDPY
jgi:hypothetical protein